MNLGTCLDQCSLALLRQIAVAHGVPVSEPPARAELIDALLARLRASGYLADFIARLDPAARDALALVAADAGQSRGFVLERQLRQSLDCDEHAAREILSSLGTLGLLYRVFQATGADRGELFVLPDELTHLLPPPSPSNAAPSPVPDPLEIRACRPVFVLFSLASFLRRWHWRPARPHPAGGQLAALEQETGDLVAELPGRTPRERWTLFAHLAVLLGLLRRDEAGLDLTDEFDDWLALGGGAAHRLWTTYVASERWNDLERAGSGAERFAGRTRAHREARAALLKVLRSLPIGVWLLLSDVERAIRDQAPDFLREGFDAATARLLDLQSGEVLAGAESWERVERPLVEYVLAGPLYWLGVVQWGRGPDTWDRIRLTDAGAAWLAESDPALAEPSNPIELTADLGLIAPADCDLTLLWRLEPYFDLARRGPPSLYALTRTSFARGLDAGGSTRALRDLLERAAAGPVPVAFRAALARWDARAGRFKVRPIVALLAEDEAELTDALRQLEGSGLVGERLGPRAAAVSAARAADLAAALERLGHLPDVDAALRLMAGRRAYAALVDQDTLEALLFSIRFARAIDRTLADEIPHAERLLRRLEQALGPISAARIARRARAAARRLRVRGRQQDSTPPTAHQ